MSESVDALDVWRSEMDFWLHGIEQRLGKALGYPWFVDEPALFPGATLADGVCVGVDDAMSLAEQAQVYIEKLESSLTELVLEFGPCDLIEAQRGYCYHGPNLLPLPCVVAEAAATLRKPAAGYGSTPF